MGKLLIYQFACIFMLAVARPAAGSARETVRDTVPSPAKPVEKPDQAAGVNAPDLIKEVPKSRRKIKPVAVPAPLPVKPPRIIKPKVIRPKVGLAL